MSTYKSPGVYIEEVPSGPQPIAAASTSVVAIIGTTRRGPVLRPTRVTGWSTFVRAFGGPIDGLFTAESVFGFFENGGPAAYIVRVDPSLAAEWTVNDAAGAKSFRIAASSPGAWANDLTVTITPDSSGGNGQMYVGRVSADTVLPQGVATPIAVDSAVGARATDQVIAVKTDGTTAEGTVDAVAPNTLTMTKPAAGVFSLVIGDFIAGRADAADSVVRLAAGSGIRAGDLLVAELPDRSRVTALVQDVAPEGAGLAIRLTAALGTDVPGAQFAERTERYRGTVGVVDETVALGEITWQGDAALRPIPADVLSRDFRAYASNGLEGVWDPGVGAGAFRFPVPPPPGAIEVEATLNVMTYTEALSGVVDPTLEALAGRFGFVPDGTDLLLRNAAGDATVTRTAVGFDLTAGALAGTFTAAEFQLPTDASLGIVVRAARPPAARDYVDFGGPLLEVTRSRPLGRDIYVLDFAANDDLSGVAGARFPLAAFQRTRFFPVRFTIGVDDRGAPAEQFAGLALDPSHPRYYFRDNVINEVSELIRVTERAPAAITADTLPTVVRRTRDGRDDPARPIDYRDGLVALETEPEPALVICPETVTFEDDLVAADVIGAVVTHCENFRRLAIVDAPRQRDDETLDQALVNWRNQMVASTYASVYAPHLLITALDPDSLDRFTTVPPSGFVAGVMARTDRERGVHKAPGNERVRGIVGLSVAYSQRRQDLLNPNAVNLIRAFPGGRGTRIWGARNATDDVTWRYTNIRRLFNFIEISVERATQWVVFEPNTPSTWLRVKVSVENFLDQLWRAGALFGNTAGEAYRVRVGLGQTMTEADIELGLVIVEVAVRAARPAEFVVFRFSHKRLSG